MDARNRQARAQKWVELGHLSVAIIPSTPGLGGYACYNREALGLVSGGNMRTVMGHGENAGHVFHSIPVPKRIENVMQLVQGRKEAWCPRVVIGSEESRRAAGTVIKEKRIYRKNMVLRVYDSFVRIRITFPWHPMCSHGPMLAIQMDMAAKILKAGRQTSR